MILDNKVAVVTSADRMIGKAVATSFAEEDGRVAINNVDLASS